MISSDYSRFIIPHKSFFGGVEGGNLSAIVNGWDDKTSLDEKWGNLSTSPLKGSFMSAFAYSSVELERREKKGHE